jgi:hypothetical protein
MEGEKRERTLHEREENRMREVKEEGSGCEDC